MARPCIRPTLLRMPSQISFLRLLGSAQKLRRYSSIGLKSPIRLPDDSVGSFRKLAFEPCVPAIFPKGSFKSLPAIERWFEYDSSNSETWRLRTSYLSRFADVTVPVELTQSRKTASGIETTFDRFEATFDHFIHWCSLERSESLNEEASSLRPTRLYLAQASLSDLPQAMKDDLPTPDIVKYSGRGDVYDSNIWMGVSPTNTPLHKDPNPNLFTQLAGHKVVRLYEPSLGLEMFRAAQIRVHGSASSAFRGPEMMQGDEKEALEEIVWGKGSDCHVEAYLESGDAIFIPKGWWHSIKGIGKGITASVRSHKMQSPFTDAYNDRQIGGSGNLMESCSWLMWIIFFQRTTSHCTQLFTIRIASIFNVTKQLRTSEMSYALNLHICTQRQFFDGDASSSLRATINFIQNISIKLRTGRGSSKKSE